jgi:putative ABC transport system permease protein
MSLFKIAWRSIEQRGLASALTAASMAISVSLVVAVLLTAGVVGETFRSNASLGYNLIIGAKGGATQLVLNTVYYLDRPVENIPYSFYQQFLSGEERGDGQKGEYYDYVDFAIPLCLGDYYQEFRVVGTTPQLFDDFVYDFERNRKYEFAEGRNFVRRSEEYGYYEAVVGAKVAAAAGLKVGDAFSPTHGAADGELHEDEFYVVGILAPSGTPNDRAVFVNMEGFYLMENHAKPTTEAMVAVTAPGSWPADETSGGSKLTPERQQITPLPAAAREVTSMLVRTKNPVMAAFMPSQIYEQTPGQAVQPIMIIEQLFSTFVEPIQYVFLAFTVLICFVSGVSILVSIYNSMSDRRHEIAVMRALGAGRRTVLSVVLLESITLSLLGGLVGWLSGHLLVGWLASGLIEERTGVRIGVFDIAPGWRLFPDAAWPWLSGWEVSAEVVLVPGLVLLAIIVGLLPAITAYKTDVAKSLSATG